MPVHLKNTTITLRNCSENLSLTLKESFVPFSAIGLIEGSHKESRLHVAFEHGASLILANKPEQALLEEIKDAFESLVGRLKSYEADDYHQHNDDTTCDIGEALLLGCSTDLQPVILQPNGLLRKNEDISFTTCRTQFFKSCVTGYLQLEAQGRGVLTPFMKKALNLRGCESILTEALVSRSQEMIFGLRPGTLELRH